MRKKKSKRIEMFVNKKLVKVLFVYYSKLLGDDEREWVVILIK